MRAIFSGKNTEELWLRVQSLDGLSTGDDIRDVIILLVELLQELEAKVDLIRGLNAITTKTRKNRAV